ncbi:MCE family protein [Mycobacterium sp. 1274761.0]|uniref:MCE family protein n=1 Tax=Mycobacterium sp. 1274761.0 TaxID=1834077 RepID=UPI000800088C|nr:MCE family protein [Mycobacterium sp. 1274761.0]OBK76468.1 MCE-family protein MCE1A [Mycobacterium sp. 1274761.0]
MTAPLNSSRTPPYKLAGIVLTLLTIVALVLVYMQFRGNFLPREEVTMMASRAGLSMDPNSKVTFNGVEIGRVKEVNQTTVGGEPRAKITLEIDKKYLDLIPKNVEAKINATTVFGNKYISFTSPKNPTPQRISSSDVIDATHVTTEFNTLFETITSIAEKVDPIKLNQTLTNSAQALQGLGDRFGQSIINGNKILGDLNPRMPQIRRDNQLLADLGDVYANAAPDLFDGLENAVTTARTLNEQQANIDQTLMASIGFGNTGAEIFEKGGPYLIRGAQDLIPTSQLLDEYSPSIFCTIRNYHDVEPKFSSVLGGNGYSLNTHSLVVGASNAYVYPDNLPRVNAHGGPEGRPGCWQPVTKDLWPSPYLVMDTGASIAPYNHIELASPFGCGGLPPCLIPVVVPNLPPLPPLVAAAPLIFPGAEYVWGRQLGEFTINP